ncbi:YciI family protein [Nocardia brasiliensis]|uniref:YciI family protein n=1 Tax=Nocardia brasiliensis TaxID=37326 RepID=UPI002456D16B|nr:YciI family protein [Nocardia brasiliensis]
MHYLATIVGGESGPSAAPGTPEFDAGVAKYAAFQEQAAAAIAGGAALYPSATAVNIRGGGEGETLITDGPFTEQNEVVTGFYVFDCANLDEAIQLARKIPAAGRGGGEGGGGGNLGAPTAPRGAGGGGGGLGAPGGYSVDP